MTRLEAVKSLIVDADTVADVGCDHGLVAKYCALSCRFKTVIASDISDKCLEKARQTCRGIDCVKFVACDGIGYECDEAVISGMGGFTVCNILDAAEKAGRLPKTLVLLPHRDGDAVRRKLNELSYMLVCDFTVIERDRFYSAMRAERCDKPDELSEIQYLFGKHVGNGDESLTAYLLKLYETYNIAPSHNEKKLSLVRQALVAQGVDIIASNKE